MKRTDKGWVAGVQALITLLIMFVLGFALLDVAAAVTPDKGVTTPPVATEPYEGFLPQKQFLTDPQDVLEFLVYVHESQRGYPGMWSHVSQGTGGPRNQAGFWVFYTLPDPD